MQSLQVFNTALFPFIVPMQFKLHLLAMDAGSDVLESLFTTLLNITT
jgi:hypothetical protein